MKHNWIDWIRDPQPLISYLRTNRLEAPQCLISGTFDIPQRNGTSNQLHIRECIPMELDDEKVLMFVANAQNHYPHMAEPAAAQQAMNLTMIWSKDFDKLERFGYDYAAGVGVPENVPSGNVLSNDIFAALYCEADRTDGFPAMITFKNLRRWYNNGNLHRKGAQPAIKADMISAVWFEEGVEHRVGGPSAICIEGYEEFHKHGDYRGYRITGETYCRWGRKNDKPPSSMNYPVRPLENKFFTDPQEEFAYIAEQA